MFQVRSMRIVTEFPFDNDSSFGFFSASVGDTFE